MSPHSLSPTVTIQSLVSTERKSISSGCPVSASLSYARATSIQPCSPWEHLLIVCRSLHFQRVRFIINGKKMKRTQLKHHHRSVRYNDKFNQMCFPKPQHNAVTLMCSSSSSSSSYYHYSYDSSSSSASKRIKVMLFWAHALFVSISAVVFMNQVHYGRSKESLSYLGWFFTIMWVFSGSVVLVLL